MTDEQLLALLDGVENGLSEAAAARIRELIAERDEAREAEIEGLCSIVALKAERDAARAEVQRLRSTVETFAVQPPEVWAAAAERDDARGMLHRSLAVIEWLAPQAGVPIEVIELVGEMRDALKGVAPPQPEIPTRITAALTQEESR